MNRIDSTQSDGSIELDRLNPPVAKAKKSMPRPPAPNPAPAEEGKALSFKRIFSLRNEPKNIGIIRETVQEMKSIDLTIDLPPVDNQADPESVFLQDAPRDTLVTIGKDQIPAEKMEWKAKIANISNRNTALTTMRSAAKNNLHNLLSSNEELNSIANKDDLLEILIAEPPFDCDKFAAALEVAVKQVIAAESVGSSLHNFLIEARAYIESNERIKEAVIEQENITQQAIVDFKTALEELLPKATLVGSTQIDDREIRETYKEGAWDYTVAKIIYWASQPLDNEVHRYFFREYVAKLDTLLRENQITYESVIAIHTTNPDDASARPVSCDRADNGDIHVIRNGYEFSLSYKLSAGNGTLEIPLLRAKADIDANISQGKLHFVVSSPNDGTLEKGLKEMQKRPELKKMF